MTTLPEAPQHRRWREARTAATERIAGFRCDLRSALDEAISLLEADTEADSATWFEISERLSYPLLTSSWGQPSTMAMMCSGSL